MTRDEIAKEACYQFVQIMIDMPLNMAMSMLATCVSAYAEHEGYDFYSILSSMANAHHLLMEGGGTNGKNNPSNSV